MENLTSFKTDSIPERFRRIEKQREETTAKLSELADLKVKLSIEENFYNLDIIRKTQDDIDKEIKELYMDLSQFDCDEVFLSQLATKDEGSWKEY